MGREEKRKRYSHLEEKNVRGRKKIIGGKNAPNSMAPGKILRKGDLG